MFAISMVSLSKRRATMEMYMDKIKSIISDDYNMLFLTYYEF